MPVEADAKGEVPSLTISLQQMEKARFSGFGSAVLKPFTLTAKVPDHLPAKRPLFFSYPHAPVDSSSLKSSGL